jgi:hypothetical protein
VGDKDLLDDHRVGENGDQLVADQIAERPNIGQLGRFLERHQQLVTHGPYGDRLVVPAQRRWEKGGGFGGGWVSEEIDCRQSGQLAQSVDHDRRRQHTSADEKGAEGGVGGVSVRQIRTEGVLRDVTRGDEGAGQSA